MRGYIIITPPCHLVAQIELSAISHNCRILRQLIPAGCWICVAVKCNAYGHGVDLVLPAFNSENVEMLCVATITEAQQLRDLGWKKPVLVLGSELSIYSGKNKAELAQWLVENKVRITATNKADIEALILASKAVKKPGKIKRVRHLFVGNVKN